MQVFHAPARAQASQPQLHPAPTPILVADLCGDTQRVAQLRLACPPLAENLCYLQRPQQHPPFMHRISTDQPGWVSHYWLGAAMQLGGSCVTHSAAAGLFTALVSMPPPSSSSSAIEPVLILTAGRTDVSARAGGERPQGVATAVGQRRHGDRAACCRVLAAECLLSALPCLTHSLTDGCLALGLHLLGCLEATELGAQLLARLCMRTRPRTQHTWVHGASRDAQRVQRCMQHPPALSAPACPTHPASSPPWPLIVP